MPIEKRFGKDQDSLEKHTETIDTPDILRQKRSAKDQDPSEKHTETMDKLRCFKAKYKNRFAETTYMW